MHIYNIYMNIVCASRPPPRPLEAVWARGLVLSGSVKGFGRSLAVHGAVWGGP